MVVATGVMSVALLGTRMALVPVGGRHVSVVSLGVMVVVGLAAYGGLAQMLGIADVKGSASFFKKRSKKLLRL
jgi:hypothetical protein